MLKQTCLGQRLSKQARKILIPARGDTRLFFLQLAKQQRECFLLNSLISIRITTG